MDIIKNVVGTNIDINDSNGDRIVNLEPQGDTYQKTTSQSNQLVNINSTSFSTQEINGVTITNNNDGSIKLNGTSTNEVALQISTEVNTPLPAGTYYLNPNKISGTGSMYSLVLKSRDSYGNIGYSTGAEATITTNQSYTKTYLYIYSLPTQTFSNLVLKPILSKTSGASWEQYIEASPSPDYPQPINVVSGRQTFTTVGKNLFNKDNVISGKRLAQNGTLTDVSANINFTSAFIKVEPNTNYMRNTTIASAYTRVCFYSSNNESSFISYVDTIGFLTPSNCQYIRFCEYLSNLDTTMLEKGSTATEYEAYTGQSYEINLGKNLYYMNYNDTTNSNWNGVDITSTHTGYSINGTATSTGAFTLVARYITLEAGTYTIALKNTSALKVGLSKTNYSGIITLNPNETSKSFTLNETTRVCLTLGITNGTQYNEENEVMICKGTNVGDFSPYKTPIELCKIGTAQDHTFKAINGDSVYDNLSQETKDTLTYGKWYIEKQTNKVVLNGSENWELNTTGVFRIIKSDVITTDSSKAINVKSNYYTNYSQTQLQNKSVDYGISARAGTGTTNGIVIRNKDTSTKNDFTTWLSTHNTIVYYVLSTPTYTEITDSELISQLNAINNALLPYGEVHISVSSSNLPSILSIDYFTQDRYIKPSDRAALINNTATIPFKINIIKNESIIKTLDEHSIVNIDYEDFRYVDTSSLVIGQFVARKISGTLDKIYTDFEIEDTELNIQMGININNNTNYYDLGNFLVTKPIDDDVKDKTTFEALDYTKKFNVTFDGTALTYPCTAQDLAIECCRQAGVELATLMFDNYDFKIPSNQYVENETCRKVMQDIGKLAYSWVRIDWDNKCYLDFDPQDYIIDENKVTNHNYYDLSLQNNVFGPVNRVVLGMKDIEGENVVIEDSASITENGVTEIQLYDNNITYTPELRQQAITKATKLFGLTYTPLESNTTGHPWLIGKEKVQITTMENEDIYTYPFDRSFSYNGHIKSKLTSKADTKTETEYKNYGDLETLVKKTRIIVDKENQEITSIVENVNTLTSLVNNQGESIDALGTRLTQTTENITASVTSIQGELADGVNLVKTNSVIIDNNGLNVSTSNSKISTTMTNNSFKIKDNGDTTLAYFGYDETARTSKAEMDNLTVKTYFVTGVHRFEKYEENGEKRTGMFYIGG